MFKRIVGDSMGAFAQHTRGLCIEADFCSYQGQAGGAYEYRFWEKILPDVKGIVDKIKKLFTFDLEGSAQNSTKMHVYTDLCESSRPEMNTGLYFTITYILSSYAIDSTAREGRRYECCQYVFGSYGEQSSEDIGYMCCKYTGQGEKYCHAHRGNKPDMATVGFTSRNPRKDGAWNKEFREIVRARITTSARTMSMGSRTVISDAAQLPSSSSAVGDVVFGVSTVPTGATEKPNDSFPMAEEQPTSVMDDDQPTQGARGASDASMATLGNSLSDSQSSGNSDPSADGDGRSVGITSIVATLRKAAIVEKWIAEDHPEKAELIALAEREFVQDKRGRWYVRSRSYKNDRIIEIMGNAFAQVNQRDRPTTMELFGHLLSLKNPEPAQVPVQAAGVGDDTFSPDETAPDDLTVQEYLRAADATLRIQSQGGPRQARDGTKPSSIVRKERAAYVRATSEVHNPHPPPMQSTLDGLGVSLETKGLQ